MAQTQLYTKRAQVFVTEETGQDTYEVQAAGDGFLAEIPDAPLQVNGENYTPSVARGDGLVQDEIPGGMFATLSFRVKLAGSGSAGTAPDFGEAIKACGYEEETVVSTSVTYSPKLVFDGASGNPGPSYSVTIVEGGVAGGTNDCVSYRIKGAFGNMVVTAESGQPIFADFTFTGGYQAPAFDALETVTYQTTSAPAYLGASFAMNFGGAVTPKGVTNFIVDTGNNVVAVRDCNDANGYYGARITSRRSFGSFDPEMVLTSTANSNFYAIQRAGTTGTLVTGNVGSTAGNIVDVNVNRAVMRPISMLNRDGIRGLEVPFSISSVNTDVEDTNHDLEIVFT